jgi:hypothetical protein
VFAEYYCSFCICWIEIHFIACVRTWDVAACWTHEWTYCSQFIPL